MSTITPSSSEKVKTIDGASAGDPTHLGFIVDGNRRWARERGLPTLEGHRRGFNKVEMVVEELAHRHLPYASFYLFSTENWNRSPEEVAYLMDLIRHNLSRLTKKLLKLDLKCVILGSRDRVAPDLLEKLDATESATAHGTAGTVCVCFNYGGQQEIADACTRILAERAAENNIVTPASDNPAQGNPTPDNSVQGNPAPATPSPLPEITPADLSAHLYHPEVPPCDMIIRTSGEERISGFMLWRAAYSEFLFLEKYFPDLTPADIDQIYTEYGSRHRRFGK